MDYKPKKEDIEYALGVYENIMKTQTLSPLEIRSAFERLYGYPAFNTQQAQRLVYSYFNYVYKAVDTTETLLPETSDTISVSSENQSHEESQPCTDCPEVQLLSQDEDVQKKIKRHRGPNKKKK